MGNARNAIASARENDMKNYRESVKLTVWYGSLPESNGKTNWTAILHNGDIASGMTIDQSEYPERVRYAADRVRWLIGELGKEPWILDYDADKHSGYVAPAPITSSPDAARDQEERETDEYVIKRLSEILAGVAVALKGPELPLHRHGYQDLVDIANALKLELELYRANAVSPAPIASAEEAAPTAADILANQMQFGADMAAKYSRVCRELAALKAVAPDEDSVKRALATYNSEYCLQRAAGVGGGEAELIAMTKVLSTHPAAEQPSRAEAEEGMPPHHQGLTRHQCNAIEYFVTQMRDEPTAVYVDMLDGFRDYINSLVADTSSSAAAPESARLVERLRKVHATLGWPEYAEAIDALESLSLENQRLRVDAERYRWLRDEANRSYVEFGVYGGAAISAPSADHLDEEVDAARSQSDKEKP
jgi:hypothetical protein